jgi:hypothetical protein
MTYTKEDYQIVLTEILPHAWYGHSDWLETETLPHAAYEYSHSLKIVEAALQLAIALQPKPIDEYSYIRGEPWVLLNYGNSFIDTAEFDAGIGCWMNNHGHAVLYPTHFYNISALPKPEVKE